MLFAAGALVPAGIVLYAQYPDWVLLYLANPAHLPPVLPELALLLGYLTSPAIGFLVAHRCLVNRRADLLRMLLAGTAATAGLMLLMAGGRLFTVAYYDDFHHGGHTVPLTGSPLVWALLMIVFFVVFSCAFSVLQIRRHSESFHEVGSVPPPAGQEQVDTVDDGTEQA